jgi:arylsulfatase A-like enzyme
MRNTSPHIDELAQEGILFTQVISQGAWTAPSLASLVTSQYPSRHGVKNIRGTPIHPSLSTLALVLKKEGYTTGVISNGILVKMGLTQGFEAWDMGENGIQADEVTRRAANFLYKNKHKKFFLWAHYIDPHRPYAPPSPYNTMYLNDTLYKTGTHVPISMVDIENPQAATTDAIPHSTRVEDTVDFDYYVAQYDGEITFTDKQIGVLLKTLKDLGLDKKTLIIVTADHGEYMGEHGFYFMHGIHLHDAVIKVPLIIRDTRNLPETKNKIISQQVRVIDVMPTILDMLNIHAQIPMEGRSLLPLILNKKSQPALYAFSELEFYGKNIYSVRTDDWKFIYHQQERKYELYNIKDDPYEAIDLIDVEQEKFNFFKQVLDKWIYRISSVAEESQ